MIRARTASLVPVVAVALAVLAVRALAFAGTELYSDEAYYWLWSRRLAAGYYDHPPAIAWLIRAGTALLAGEAGVRLFALLCGAATILFAALLARELSDDPRAPRWAAWLALSAPMLHLVGALALPDAPLAASTTAAAWLLARARGPRWIAAGFAVGLALLSKYTAGLLAPALLLLAAWDPQLRSELRGRWPWLGATVAVLVFAPCLAWNARHDWVSLAFQLQHGFGGSGSWGAFLELLAALLVGAGPVVLVAGVVHLARARASPARRAAAVVFVPLVVTLVAAARGKVEANWPALVYPALAAAAAASLVRWRGGRALVAGSVLLSLGALGLFALEQRNPRLLAGTPAVERFHGWRELAAFARESARRACPDLGCDPDDPFVVPANYQYAGALAFYGGFDRLGPAPERRSQLDLWGDRPRAGEPFLLVGFEGMDPRYLRELSASGERATERHAVVYRGVTVRRVTVTLFAHYAGPQVRR